MKVLHAGGAAAPAGQVVVLPGGEVAAVGGQQFGEADHVGEGAAQAVGHHAGEADEFLLASAQLLFDGFAAFDVVAQFGGGLVDAAQCTVPGGDHAGGEGGQEQGEYARHDCWTAGAVAAVAGTT